MIARWLPLWAAMVSCNAWLLARPGDAPASAADAECHADADCVLLPAELTCCHECPPAPPFHAAPRWVLDGMLVESETTCSYDTRPCAEDACDPVPAGCVARAVCEAGRCVVAASGCGERLASESVFAAGWPDRTSAALSASVGGVTCARTAGIQARCERRGAPAAARREVRR